MRIFNGALYDLKYLISFSILNLIKDLQFCPHRLQIQLVPEQHDLGEKLQLILCGVHIFHLNEKIYIFPCQNLKRFAFRVKLSDSIFFLLDLSLIVKLIHKKQIFKHLREKYCLIHLEIVKIP